MKISELIKDPRTLDITLNGEKHTLHPLTAETEERIRKAWPEPIYPNLSDDERGGNRALVMDAYNQRIEYREARLRCAVVAISARWTDDDGTPWPDEKDSGKQAEWLKRVGEAMMRVMPDKTLAYLWAKYMDVSTLPIAEQELVGSDFKQGN